MILTVLNLKVFKHKTLELELVFKEGNKRIYYCKRRRIIKTRLESNENLGVAGRMVINDPATNESD
jgi:hypothetical protein